MERGSFTREFEGKVRFCFYQGMYRSRRWKWASLSIVAPLGNLEWAHLPGTLGDG